LTSGTPIREGSQTSADEFRNVVLLFMWASLLLTLATALLLFTSVFFQWPLNFNAGERLIRGGAVYTPSAEDPKVWALQEKVNDLRGTWETVPQYGEVKRAEVLERATKLADALVDVDDKSLGPSGRAIKREFSCYALIMAASTETDTVRKEEIAKRGISQCEDASRALASILSKKNQSSNFAYTAAWIKEEDQVPFTGYLLAMATCIEGVATGSRDKKIAATKILKKIEGYYLDKYPPARDYTLKKCISNAEEATRETNHSH
jgi:hypothetical protein